MNIISGIAGGIRLDVPKGVQVRPTAALARKSLFDSLGPLCGKTVLDLYAGSGALGLEAASRGAETVLLVDSARRSVETIKTNAERVKKAGVMAVITALQRSAETCHTALPELDGQIDLILADPPYDDASGIAARLLVDNAFARWARNALLVFETSLEISRKLAVEDVAGGWGVVKTKKVGQTVFLFLRVKQSKAET